MTLFWHPTGPRIRFLGGVLFIEDLNPETRMQWRMSQWEMFKLGVRCLFASVSQ